MPFGTLVGVDITADDLFHLAPIVALKFRGLPGTRRNLKRATDAALCSYVATTSDSPELRRFPTICFAFAYLASHFGLDLVSEKQVNEVMDHIAENPEELLAPTSRGPHSKLHPSAPTQPSRGRKRTPSPKKDPRNRTRKAT